MDAAALLDDLSAVTRLDPKGMYGLTVAFPDQCETAVGIAQQASVGSLPAGCDLVMLSGLGGSAAGGDFVRALFEAHGKIPFLVNRDYFLPAYVGPKTLVVACSYSGNTEETLSAYADAKSKGASILCITSGGKLAELAKADGFPLITIPGGQPPRTALGFLLMPVIVACEKLGLLPAQDYAALIAHLRAEVVRLGVGTAFSQNPAKQLAANLFGKVSVLYGLGPWQGLVANRWKGQINENSKNMTFANTFPELNHNEILGWVRAMDQGVRQWVTVVLEDGTEIAKLKKRCEVTSRLIKDVSEIYHVQATGSNLMEKMIALALYGDFVSLYLAAMNEVDPENIDTINILKTELASVPM